MVPNTRNDEIFTLNMEFTMMKVSAPASFGATIPVLWRMSV